MIPEIEFAELQHERERWMTERVTVKRDVVLGPNLEEQASIASDVPASIAAGFGTFRDVADRFSGITPYTITVPLKQDVRPGDYLVDVDGDVFNVRDVRRKGTRRIVTICLTDWIH